jgi:uncharacterized protein (TIGR03437 family)
MSAKMRLLSVLLSGSLAMASTGVAPTANATAAGNATNPIPLTSSSIEVQELVGNGQLPSPTFMITGLSFRAAPGTGPIKAAIGSLSVYLSTSPNYPNTSGSGKTLMSPTFANNVGPDKTLVYSGTNVTWSDSGCAAPGPCPFDINIVFTTPFLYSGGGNGTLLIDMVETGVSATSGTFDAASFAAPGGGVSQVTGTGGAAAGTFSYQGSVVQLTYTSAAQIPSFSGIVNPASNIPPGFFQNSGIAQGSIFVVYGSNLGPASLAQASTLPLPTTAGLGGTSIGVTVGGTTVNAPMLYTSQGQVAAVLPSNTPVGTGGLTLTYNGLSGTTPITVVASNFGISTVNESGSGPAVVTFPNYSVVSSTNSAKPGDTLILWGTGLGPLPAGSSDASGAAGPLGITPSIQVFVGGVAAQVLYAGRTPTAVGLDQINFVVPASAPAGCNVSIVVQTTSPAATVSNGPTMSIASADGAPCSDPTQTIPTSYLSKSGAKIVYAALQQQASVSYTNGVAATTTSGSAAAGFFQFSQAQLSAQAALTNTEPSLGSCLTGIVPGSGSSNGPPVATYLNGGTSVTLTPPTGAPLTLASSGAGSGVIYQNGNVTSAIPAGTWNFSNTGGAGVGPLSFTFPVPAQVTWTNQAALTSTSIARAQPLTVTWSGGDANGYVDILGQASVGSQNAPNYTYYFDCAAPTAAGQFAVPPSVMLGMPVGASAYASLQVSTFAFPVTAVAVPGFDAFLNTAKFQVSVPVVFK